MTTKRDEYRARVLAALRSGEYKQGRGALRSSGRFCCLGVICDTLKEELELEEEQRASGVVLYGGMQVRTPHSVVEALGLYGCFGEPAHPDPATYSLARLNDEERKTFAEIADILEAGGHWKP